MRQIEINLIFAADAVAFETDLEYLAGRDVARDEIAVGRIFFFEKIPALGIGNVTRRASIGRISRHPDAAAFAAGGFAHQSQFVFAGDRGRMDLNEFAVGITGPCW